LYTAPVQGIPHNFFFKLSVPVRVLGEEKDEKISQGIIFSCPFKSVLRIRMRIPAGALVPLDFGSGSRKNFFLITDLGCVTGTFCEIFLTLSAESLFYYFN
jgi:hypothetical protein